MFGKDPIRLSIRPRGGQGEPYGDDVVAVVRRLVEETRLSHKEIGARTGVSHMTRRWLRPSGAWGEVAAVCVLRDGRCAASSA